MSQFVGELCALLIEDTYGDFYSHIFSTLLEHGRLSLIDLGRHCHLSSRHIRQGVAALIQSHLIHHYTAPTGQTFYSANWESAYNLVRVGRILRAVEDKLGKYPSLILTQILLLGHARVDHLSTFPVLVSSHTKDLPNGGIKTSNHGASDPQNGSKHTVDDLLNALQQLSDAGFIRQVRTSHFQSANDNRDDADRHVQVTHVFNNTKGKRMQEELGDAVESELRKRKECSFPLSTFRPRLINGVKRSNDAVDDLTSRKRMKLTSDANQDLEGALDQAAGLGGVPAGNIMVQVNHSKFMVLMRNQCLVSMAEQALGKPTAKVYREALRQTEKETLECRPSTTLLPAGAESDHSSPLLDIDRLASGINARINLDGTIAPWTPKESGINGLNHRSTIRRKRPPDLDQDPSDDENEGVDEHGNISGIEHDTEDDEANQEYNALAPSKRHRTNGTRTNGFIPPTHQLLQHLHLLAEAPEEFVKYETTNSIASWRIDFDSICRSLRDQKIFSIISDLFGDIALRLVRVLMDKGKLEEKALQEIALVSAKDLRHELAQLQTAGFLELQEVPRENQRQPSRTIYLWFYDPDRVRRKVLEDTYKSMSRILQRLKIEKQNAQSVLDKAERSDVKGHEEQYLGTGELETLEKWKAKEEMFWGEIGRLDDLVAVLRDF